MLKKYKNMLLGLVTIVILFVAYLVLVGGSGEDALLTSREPEGPGATVERELVSLLLELRSIELDESIFSDPTFRSLQDFSKPLEPQPVGRSNPFAPISSDTSGGS